MRQDVVVVGSDLSSLVPFSLAFHGTEYSVTLATDADPITCATSFAATRKAWLIVLLDGGETTDACAALHKLAPLVLFVTCEDHETLRRSLYALDIPVIREDEGPLVALASLVATTRWLASAPSKKGLAEPGRLTPGSAG